MYKEWVWTDVFAPLFFTKIGWENWNAFKTVKENGRNIFQTTVAYIHH